MDATQTDRVSTKNGLRRSSYASWATP